MRSLWITATIVTAAIAVNGCKHRKRRAAAGPAIRADQRTGRSRPCEPSHCRGHARSGSARESRAGGREHRSGASGISFFQGTVEEAFSKTGAKGKVLLRF